ncbi:malonyl CoA-acyl carrier protein transacylase [Polycladomyces abyssicola]|uniref:Malonyl CoA-acyl carrier protein transacylase n=1 Tax=Polycladomyces abyssicola TaxID=1125966 RepID=A0A8D5ZNL4_9BACL|nr:malonate decarboxylase subunit epsilon [Polycladomyces abyssicola]BCU81483.1 malonyl CoA-acyl carrier protein transacylase [Polycladomyces abyssicola]
MSVAFLFPGQGSQQPDMLHELPDHPVITQTLEEASTILDKDIFTFDTDSALSSTTAVQIALFVAGVSTARALKAEGAMPDMVAGHSVGAFAAAVVAGALDFRDALSLVKLRGELMENAFPQGYGMAAVIGLDERRLASLIGQVGEPVFIANLNAPDQITIAGSIPGIEAALAMASAAGAHRAEILRVSVPSHCPLLQHVSYQLARALDEVHFREPVVPYGGNRRARALRDPEAIREDLAMSVAHPVRWHEVTTLFFELGARLFLEMPPGHVLTDLVAAAFPAARSISVTKSGLDSAVIITRREKGRTR